MNKEQYIYANGKIIIETDNRKKLFSHYEGFEKILSQENLVETIEKNINFYNMEKLDLKKKTLTKTIFKVMGVVGIYVLLAGSLIALNGITGITALYSLIALAWSGGFIYEYVDTQKKLKAIDYALIYLYEELLEAKNDLEELEQKEKIYTEPKQDFYLGNISSIAKGINNVNIRTNLYYDCGYNYKKYILWYKLGLLREKLAQSSYTEYGLDKIERCMATDAFQEKESVIRKLTIATRKKVKK